MYYFPVMELISSLKIFLIPSFCTFDDLKLDNFILQNL